MTRAVDSRGGTRATTSRRVLPAAGVRLLAAFTAVSLAASPVLAANNTKPATKPVKPRFSFETPVIPFQSPVTDASKFSFTAAGTNASSARLQTVERAFRFTPSGQSDNSKALSLGVNTRMTAAAPDRSRTVAAVETAALPTAYDVDLSVAWKGFAINTGFSRAEPSPTALLAGRREAVDIGVSYRGRNWQTSLQGTAEDSQLLSFAPIERRYSVELEGAYSVAPRLSVTGGVRYKLAPAVPSLLDIDAADRSVYFGTNFAF